MQILDGKKVSSAVRMALKTRIKQFENKHQRQPGLAVVLVGDDPGSQVYVRNKIKACEEVGIRSFHHHLAKSTSVDALRKLVFDLNENRSVDGILVQLPLPEHLNKDEVLGWINPRKDPDGLTIENMGALLAGKARIAPCTPSGVIEILEHYKIPIAGQKALVVGRSQIVGKPMALLLLEKNATVTVAHSKTPDLEKLAREFDIVVVAAGKPRLLGRNAFKKTAVVIDVGMHRLENGLCGDVRFEELDGHVAAATPVPGGVGPMTIAMLLSNTLKLAEQNS